MDGNITWIIGALSACTQHTRKVTKILYTESVGFIPAAQQYIDGEPTGIHQLLLDDNGEVVLSNTQQAAMSRVKGSDLHSHCTFSREIWRAQREAHYALESIRKIDAEEAELFDAEAEDLGIDGKEASNAEE